MCESKVQLTNCSHLKKWLTKGGFALNNAIIQQIDKDAEMFSGWIAEGCAECDSLIDLSKFLRNKLVNLRKDI